MHHSARVAWFEAAYRHLRNDRLEEAPPAATITVGFTSTKGGQNPKRGECHFECFTEQKEFGASNVIVIHHATLGNLVEALGVLLHEMIHAALEPDVKHRRPFQDLAKRVGLEKPWTATTPNHTLQKYLSGLVLRLNDEIGPLPVGHYEPPPPPPRRPPSTKPYICACRPPRKFRLSKNKMAAGAILCGVCRQPFTEEDDGPAR